MESLSTLYKLEALIALLSTITKTRLFKYIENFATKNGKFSDENFWYFFIFLLKT